MKQLDILQSFLDKMRSHYEMFFIVIPCADEHIADALIRALAKRNVLWKDWINGSQHLLSRDNRWTLYKQNTAYIISESGLLQVTDNLVSKRLTNGKTDHVVLHPLAILFNK